jgi:hypothetical protein
VLQGATSQEIVVGIQENNPPDAVLEATPDSLKAHQVVRLALMQLIPLLLLPLVLLHNK